MNSEEEIIPRDLIPIADIFILTPIQAYMATKLASIHGVSINKATAWENVTDLGKVIGLGLLAQQLVIGGYKTFIPFYGAVTTIPLVYGMNYAIGRILNEMESHSETILLLQLVVTV